MSDFTNFPLVSIILPVYNAEEWLDSCLQSILAQTHTGLLELCIYNDACTDLSMTKVDSYASKLLSRNIRLKNHANVGIIKDQPKGIFHCCALLFTMCNLS